MITVTECEKPHNLNYSSVTCDNPLNKKLDRYPLLQCFNTTSSLNMLIGSPGSGKSSLVQALFSSPFRKCYHNIFLFRPPTSSTMNNDIFDKLPNEMIFNELSVKNLEHVLDQITQSPRDECHAIIFDDMAAYFKTNEIQTLLKQLLFNRRHLRTSVFIISQSYKCLPLNLRKIIVNFIIFKVSKLELSEIFRENVDGYCDAITEKISRVVYDQPHNFLLVNTQNRLFFKNWDKLNIMIDED